MVFGDNFQGSGEVFRIKHGFKCFMVYYLWFIIYGLLFMVYYLWFIIYLSLCKYRYNRLYMQINIPGLMKAQGHDPKGH